MIERPGSPMLPILGSWATGELFKPMSNAVGAFINDKFPIAIPPLPLMLQMYYQGFIGGDDVSDLLKKLGVTWHPDGKHADERLAILGVIWDVAIKADQYRPAFDDWFAASLRGLIAPELYDAKIKSYNARKSDWEGIKGLYSNYPALTETLTLRNRGFFTDGESLENLKRLGFTDEKQRSNLVSLRYYVPSIPDLIHFAVKEAFSPAVANAAKLYDETPTVIKRFMEMQGAEYELEFNINSDGKERKATLLDLYWASHWQPISPTQSYEMFHRLRPSRIKRFRDEGYDVEPFTLVDVRRWLRIDDYPPGVRDYLAAIAYRPMRLVDIRNAHFLDIIGRDEVKEQFLDRGHHPADAETQTKLLERQKIERKNLPIKRLQQAAVGKSISHAIEAYDVGIINRGQAEDRLKAAGLDQPTSNTILNNADEETRIKLVKESLRSIRSKFMDGTLSLQSTIDALRLLNLQEDRLRAHIDHWILQRRTNRKVATTGQILRWVGEGLMTPADGLLRLENLGWVAPDTLIQLAEATHKLAEMRAKQLAAEDKEARTRGKELESLVKASQKEVEKMQADLRRISPVSRLQKWLKLGYVGEEFALNRLVSMGYPAEAASVYVREALEGKKNGDGEKSSQTSP